MATELLRVGPTDESFNPGDEYYSESRGTSHIERELVLAGFDFSFERHLRNLAKRFPHADPINVFEAGCGYAVTLGDIKRLEAKVGRAIKTTGITMATRHIESAESLGVERLIVGSIQNYAQMGALSPESQHFILDFYGPTRYNHGLSEKVPWEGEETIPVYSRLLVPGGTALVVAYNLNEEIARISGDIERRNRMIDLFERNGLVVVKNKGSFVLLEKQAY